MKDIYDYEFPALAHPTSVPDNDCDNDSYFTEGEETFDDGVPRQIEQVEKPPVDVDALIETIEAQIPDDVLELFGNKKSKKKEAA